MSASNPGTLSIFFKFRGHRMKARPQIFGKVILVGLLPRGLSETPQSGYSPRASSEQVLHAGSRMNESVLLSKALSPEGLILLLQKAAL